MYFYRMTIPVPLRSARLLSDLRGSGRNRFRVLMLSLLACLWVAPALTAQNSLYPYKLSLYRDAARISYKGVINFSQQRADIPLDHFVDPSLIDLAVSPPAHVRWYKTRVDSVSRRTNVSNWADVLRANMSRPVSILYEIGGEGDEVEGDVRFVDEVSGLVLLHAANNSEYYIPISQIRQVIYGNISDYKLDKRLPVTVLEVGLDSDVATAPVEVFSVVKDVLSWTPICRVRILGSNKARLQVQASIKNEFADFADVELELDPREMMGSSAGMAESEAIAGGKMSVAKNEYLVLNLRDTELEYEATYRSHLPWKGLQADGKLRSSSVDNALRLALPNNFEVICDTYTVLDEHNRFVANLHGSTLEPDGKVSLALGPADDIKVSLVETEVERDSKPVKVGDLNYDKITVQGRLVLQNFGQKFVTVTLSRELVGEVTDAAKGLSSNSPNGDNYGPLAPYAKTLTWKQALDKGQKKEIVFQYNALVPRP
jgi:hypothetical protein